MTKLMWGSVGSVVVAAMLGGCAQSGLYEPQKQYRLGDIAGSREAFEAYAERNPSSEHRVIAKLQLGDVRFHTGDYAGAASAFQAAENDIEKIDMQPEVSLSEEGKAALTNPQEITYDGMPYDRVLATVYRGLSFAATGNFDAARSAFINAEQRQIEAVQKREKLIAKAKEQGKDSDNAKSIEGANEAYPESFFDGYDVVANSFADVAVAVFRLGQSLDTSDADTAVFNFNRVAELNPENSYLAEDAAIAARGGGAPDRTYVLFGTGFGPYRDQVKLPVPYPSVEGTVKTTFVAYPVLRQDDGGYLPALTVESDGTEYRTEVIADMDRIIGGEFKVRLPVIMTRHTTSAITRTIAREASDAAAGEIGGDVEVVMRLFSFGYSAAQNEADRRMWATLPKYYGYASFENPRDGIVRLQDSVTGSRTVRVNPVGTNIIVVRSTRPQMPMHVLHIPMAGPVAAPASGGLAQQ